MDNNFINMFHFFTVSELMKGLFDDWDGTFHFDIEKNWGKRDGSHSTFPSGGIDVDILDQLRVRVE